ncbi:Catalase [Cedecea neteri]|uniref:Catalase n=1 Tax=Cedecea neteri TaxID=158822 RepID=A0A2X2TC17_9ENTR|nr:Catalase [Cedecea neteri]
MIVAIPLALCLLFAWAWGALTPGRLSPDKLVNALEKREESTPAIVAIMPKASAWWGILTPTAAAAPCQKQRCFCLAIRQLLGVWRLPAVTPTRPDGAVPVRSMALQFITRDGQEWRTGMNALPFFSVATPQGFYDQQMAGIPDPKTGKTRSGQNESVY